jgi:hypothetical protein
VSQLTPTAPDAPIFVKTLEQAEIDTEALKLRSTGLTYQRVADSMGCSKQTAYDRVKRALQAIPFEAVQEYRQIMGEQLDSLLEVALEKALSRDKGAMFGIDRVLMIMDRKARLFGLDAPIKQHVEVVNYDGNSIEARVAELRSALESVGGVEIPVDG